MKVSGPAILAVATVAIMASCGGRSQSPPTVTDYRNASRQPHVTPYSLCYRNSNHGWKCSSGGTGDNPCAIYSQAVAVPPIDVTRTQIGVGEQVKLTTVGFGFSVTGDGTLSNVTATQATLTAGPTSGTATVSVGPRAKICSANTLDFTVVAPVASIYMNMDNNVAHLQGYASVGIQMHVYLAPDNVSFSGLTWHEVQETFSANGAWQCKSGTPHEPYPPPTTLVGPDVPGIGSQTVIDDQANSGTCPGNQFQNSSETVVIPSEYAFSTSGPWYRISSVTHAARATVAGNLTISKDHAFGQTAVNNPNQGF